MVTEPELTTEEARATIGRMPYFLDFLTQVEDHASGEEKVRLAQIRERWAAQLVCS